LATKIEYILDDLLPLIGLSRNEREEEFVEVSDESSDNY